MKVTSKFDMKKVTFLDKVLVLALVLKFIFRIHFNVERKVRNTEGFFLQFAIPE